MVATINISISWKDIPGKHALSINTLDSKGTQTSKRCRRWPLPSRDNHLHVGYESSALYTAAVRDLSYGFVVWYATNPLEGLPKSVESRLSVVQKIYLQMFSGSYNATHGKTLEVKRSSPPYRYIWAASSQVPILYAKRRSGHSSTYRYRTMQACVGLVTYRRRPFRLHRTAL